MRRRKRGAEAPAISACEKTGRGQKKNESQDQVQGRRARKLRIPVLEADGEKEDSIVERVTSRKRNIKVTSA